MDSFSGIDGLRALCAPLCCCWRGRLALSPSTDSLEGFAADPEAPNQRAQDARGEDDAGGEAGQNAYDGAAYEARTTPSLAAPSDDFFDSRAGTGTLRPRQRRRGGDISGGGTDSGSGLTRWTLFRSWLRGRGGSAVRLEGDDDDESGNIRLDRTGSTDGLLGPVYGDEDAPTIALDDVHLPPAPPSREGAASTVIGPPSSSGLTSSDGRSNSDPYEDPEREARRQMRRARRALREEEVMQQPVGLAQDAADTLYPSAGRLLAGPPSQVSSESSGRRRRRLELADEQPSQLDGDHLVNPGLRELRAFSEERKSQSSLNADARARAEVPHEGKGPSSSSSTSSKRKSHRSKQSISSHGTSASSASSGTRSHRRHERKYRDETRSAQAPRSPLEAAVESEYFQDEDGQLRVRPSEDDEHRRYAQAETGSPYDHIGVLPVAPDRTEQQ